MGGGEAPTVKSGFFTPSLLSPAIRSRVVSLFALSLLTACTAVQPHTQVTPRLAHATVRGASSQDLMSDVILRARTTPSDAHKPQADATLDASDLARAALTQLGVKYRYGGKTPTTGFDCSGLVVYAAEQSLGLKLPHHSATLARMGVAVKHTQLQAGDLVFFNTRGRKFSHMGIYLGNQQFVHAPRTGSVVRVERMDKPYWQKRYNGARRLDTDALVALSGTAQNS